MQDVGLSGEDAGHRKKECRGQSLGKAWEKKGRASCGHTEVEFLTEHAGKIIQKATVTVE